MEHSIVKLATLYLLWKKRKEKKKKRRMWIHAIVGERQSKGQFSNLFFELRRDEEKFFNYMRMSIGSFDELLNAIKTNITKTNTRMRTCIPPEEKLVITLRYLATGCSLTDLHYNFRVGRSTASSIIKDVCNAIWVCLLEKTIPKLCSEKWKEIAEGFERNAKFPNCIGAIDGKHIRLKQPPNSGSMYYNYKNYFSTVLFAMCDSNYCLTYIDVGSYGKSSDSGVFKHSTIFDKLCENSLGIPQPRCLSNSTETFPYVIVGDEAFPLMENLLRPFGGKHLSDDKSLFNLKLSKARRYIECTFGILANKWRIFHRAIDVDIDLAEAIIKSCCVLHNFVRTRDGTHDQVSEDEIIISPEGNLLRLEPDSNHRGNFRAVSSRDKYCRYFAKNIE